jgi:AraC-like DNA-binding protein
MDALSELLRVVKLRGALFFDSDCSAPWCVSSPPSAELGRYFGVPDARVIEFHFVAQGRGYIRVGGETIPIAAGDIVMMPHGDAHHMGNGLAVEALDGAQALPPFLRGEVHRSSFGGGGEVTRLVCGFLACEGELVAPLLAGLPRVVRVQLRGDRYGDSLEQMVRHALDQHADRVPGSDAIVARLAEMLFTEALRRYAAGLPPDRSGWLAGAADPSVGRALAALHQRPAHAWTLDDLAAEAGVSRSSLTERFARYLGQAPMAYLADWRLQLAAEALHTTSRSVMTIAGDVGYESEAAFNRAFKRRFALPPARYRKLRREGVRAERIS